jgi:hypothetical protein
MYGAAPPPPQTLALNALNRRVNLAIIWACRIFCLGVSLMHPVALFVIVIMTVGSNNVVRSTARSPMRTCCLLVTVSFFPSIISLSYFRNILYPFETESHNFSGNFLKSLRHIKQVNACLAYMC